MKKLIFLSVLSLLLGLVPFSTAHDAKASVYSKKATQFITFSAYYSWNNLPSRASNLYINGQFVALLFAGPNLVIANIGDSFFIQDLALGRPCSGSGTITSTNMLVPLYD